MCLCAHVSTNINIHNHNLMCGLTITVQHVKQVRTKRRGFANGNAQRFDAKIRRQTSENFHVVCVSCMIFGQIKTNVKSIPWFLAFFDAPPQPSGQPVNPFLMINFWVYHNHRNYILMYARPLSGKSDIMQNADARDGSSSSNSGSFCFASVIFLNFLPNFLQL